MRDSLKFYKLSAFALGLFSFFSVSGFAQIIPVEIIALIATIFSPLLLRKCKFSMQSDQLRIFLFGFLWLIGQVASNYINKSEFLESSKNIAQILVLLCLLFWGFYWASRNPIIVFAFLWGYLFSSIPQYAFLPGLYGRTDPWKFIFGPALTLMALILIQHLSSSRLITFLAILPLLLTDFLLGARSLGLITFFSVVLMLKVSLKQRGLVYSSSFLIVISVLLFFTYSTYSNLASRGSLGLTQQEKFLRQANSGPILLVARSELIYELSAIRESGIFGLGSSPTVDNNFLQGVALEEYKYGVNHQSTSAYNDYIIDKKIPSHSMLFGAWMEAGVFGALFWLYLTWLVIRSSFRATGREPHIGLAARYLSVNFLWAVFFSPLGAGSRMLVALTLTLVMQAGISKVGVNGTAI